jgi:hypothetical protein
VNVVAHYGVTLLHRGYEKRVVGHAFLAVTKIMGACLPHIRRKSIGDSRFIPKMVLLIVGGKRLPPPNFDLFLERIQYGWESWMLFLFYRRVCWPFLKECYGILYVM